MRVFLFALGLFGLCSSAFAAETFKFNFVDKEITDIIANYAKASGKKFVVDASVHGKVSILAPNEVNEIDAFALLSDALSTTNAAIVQRGDTYVVEPARNAAHDGLPVLTELPSEKPERLVTMVFQPKNLSAEKIYQSLRILTSRDGEMIMVDKNGKIVLTDWVSNVKKIAKVIETLDQPTPH